MEEETILKKIFNFFLHVFLAITSFFRRLFGKDEKVGKNVVKEKIKKVEPKKEEKVINSAPTTLPNTSNVNANDHSSHSDNEGNGNKDDGVILKLTNNELKKIKINEAIYIINSIDELDELINECLEEEYEEEELKIKKASKEVLLKIKEFKEEIIDTIKENTVRKQIETRVELKEEIKEVIKEEIKTKPLMPKLEDLNKDGLVEKRNHVYFLATPLKKVLNINEDKNVKAKPEILITIPDKKTLKKKLNEKPYFMVQNVKEVPKEDVKEDIKNAAIVGGMLGAKAVLDLVTPLPEEIHKEEIDKDVEAKSKELNLDEEKPQVTSPESVLETKMELPKLKELEEQLETIKDEKKSLSIVEEKSQEIKETLELEQFEDLPKEDIESFKEEEKQVEKKHIETKPKTKQEIKQKEKILESRQAENEKEPEQIPKKEEIAETKEEVIKNNRIADKIDTNILEIALATASLIVSTKKEEEKKELEDKDYDSKEEQINKMLDDIEVTLLKYDGKMSEKQKTKLKQEQERLRDTKEHLATKKQEDITREAQLLDETIKEVELSGLQNELKRLHAENQLEMNETLLNRINGLENLTQEQIANIDKKMLMKRLNKVSALMEMSSILALPFVRNKYFFYFTIGLIIDNHFNFINAFFKRKINRYEPADLEQIKQGEDALNSALNMTYKNQVQLEYVVNQALARYPELANEPLFTNKVNNLRMQLEHSYQKMMNKKNIMEKYHRKTKSQIKVLKRTGDLEEAA